MNRVFQSFRTQFQNMSGIQDSQPDLDLHHLNHEEVSELSGSIDNYIDSRRKERGRDSYFHFSQADKMQAAQKLRDLVGGYPFQEFTKTDLKALGQGRLGEIAKSVGAAILGKNSKKIAVEDIFSPKHIDRVKAYFSNLKYQAALMNSFETEPDAPIQADLTKREDWPFLLKLIAEERVGNGGSVDTELALLEKKTADPTPLRNSVDDKLISGQYQPPHDPVDVTVPPLRQPQQQQQQRSVNINPEDLRASRQSVQGIPNGGRQAYRDSTVVNQNAMKGAKAIERYFHKYQSDLNSVEKVSVTRVNNLMQESGILPNSDRGFCALSALVCAMEYNGNKIKLGDLLTLIGGDFSSEKELLDVLNKLYIIDQEKGKLPQTAQPLIEKKENENKFQHGAIAILTCTSGESRGAAHMEFIAPAKAGNSSNNKKQYVFSAQTGERSTGLLSTSNYTPTTLDEKLYKEQGWELARFYVIAGNRGN